MMNHFKLILSSGYFIVSTPPPFTKLSQASKSSTHNSEFEVQCEFSYFILFLRKIRDGFKKKKKLMEKKMK